MNKKIIEYDVISSNDISYLVKVIKSKIKEDWQPLGGIFFRGDYQRLPVPSEYGCWGVIDKKLTEIACYMQAMVKYE